jgi:hypothetical protein
VHVFTWGDAENQRKWVDNGSQNPSCNTALYPLYVTYALLYGDVWGIGGDYPCILPLAKELEFLYIGHWPSKS